MVIRRPGIPVLDYFRKITLSRVRSVLKSYIFTEMKFSAVVDREGGSAGRTGTEKLKWRTDRRNLVVLVKQIYDIIYTPDIYIYICIYIICVYNI